MKEQVGSGSTQSFSTSHRKIMQLNINDNTLLKYTFQYSDFCVLLILIYLLR